MPTPGRLWSRTPLLYATALLVMLGVASMLAGPLQQGRLASVLPLGLIVLGVICVLAFTQPLILLGAGFALLAVVKSEPAPVDVVFAILMSVTLLSGWVRPHVPAPIEILLWLTAAVTLLSAVNAVDTRRAVQYAFVSLYLLALAVWLTWVFTSEKATHVAIMAYIAVAAASSLLVIGALYLHLPGGSLLVYGSSRGMGLFKDPNVYAPFLVPAAVIALEEIGRPRLFGWRRRFTVALFILLAAGVVVGFSRAAWLNLGLACATLVVVTAFRRGGTRVALRSIAALAFAGLAGFTLLAATGSLAFLKERSKLESYDQQRFGTQSSAFERIGEHVFGHGPGQVERTLDISTHSFYARAAFEQGMPGLSLLLLLVGTTLLYAFLLVRSDASIHGIGSAALLGSWIGLLVNGAFVDTIHWRHLYVVAALIWCAAASHGGPTARAAKGMSAIGRR